MRELIDEIKTRLGSVRDVLEEHSVQITGKKFRCIVPGHEDKHPSASLHDDDQRFKCHSCGARGDSIETWAILNGVDNAEAIRTLAEQFGLNGSGQAIRKPSPATSATPWKPHGKIVESYSYTAIDGTPLRKDRYEPKFFTWRHLGDEKQWLKGQGGHKPMPYNYEAIADACDVYLVEGEKDVATGKRAGICCVSVEKDAQWPQEWLVPFQGINVHVIPDHDDAGRTRSQTCAHNLHGTAAEVRIIALPGIDALDEGADLTDWLDAGHHVGELADVVCTTLVWEPAPDPAPEGDDTGPDVRMVCLADVERRPIEWLWPGRFALGKMSLIPGDPGTGKSHITLDLAARVTRGLSWPDGSGNAPGGSVIILHASEDDEGDTIVPRLMAAGADMTRIHTIEAVVVKKVNDDGEPIEREIEITLDDIDAIRQALRQTSDVRLIIVDPISAFLGETDSHRNAEVRRLLRPLSALLAEYRVALVAITHLNKGGGGRKALYRAMDSLAFVAMARAVYGVMKDEDDPARRLFLPVKNNIADDTTGLAYRLMPWEEDPNYMMVVWEPDPVRLTADEALNPEEQDTRYEWEEARDWLRELLRDGRVEASVVYEQGEKHKFSEKTLRKASKKLKVLKKKDGYGEGAPWYWSLPEPP